MTWPWLRLAYAGRYGGVRKRFHALRPDSAELQGARAFCGARPKFWQAPFTTIEAQRIPEQMCSGCARRLHPIAQFVRGEHV